MLSLGRNTGGSSSGRTADSDSAPIFLKKRVKPTIMRVCSCEMPEINAVVCGYFRHNFVTVKG